MKNAFVIILTLIEFLAFGQEKNLDQIDNVVKFIESDTTLLETEVDWLELTGITTDGGGFLKVWQNEKQICKIVEEIGLSYGRIRTVIYLNNGIPIKIIETEENLGHDNGELNYKELNEVFRATIYVFEWENNDGKIERSGKRVMSEGSCTFFDYEPIIERAEKATSD
jgi:hypothetical protein